jgi:hypothetical protein
MASHPSPRNSRPPSATPNGHAPSITALDATSKQPRQPLPNGRPAQPLTWVLANHAKAYLESQQCMKVGCNCRSLAHTYCRRLGLYIPQYSSHNRRFYFDARQTISRVPRTCRSARTRLYYCRISRHDYQSQISRYSQRSRCRRAVPAKCAQHHTPD